MKTHCQSIAFLLSLLLLPAAAVADDKAAVMELGKTKYVLCTACHGIDGKGMQPAPGMIMAPAYSESAVVKSDAEWMALIVMKGLKKEDAKYLGIMAPLETALNDTDLAAVLTYVRNTWGDHDEVVTADEVAAWRAKYKDIMQPISRAELAEKMK